MYSIDMLVYGLLYSYLARARAGISCRWARKTDVHAAHVVHASIHTAVVHAAVVHVAVIVVHCYRRRGREDAIEGWYCGFQCAALDAVSFRYAELPGALSEAKRSCIEAILRVLEGIQWFERSDRMLTGVDQKLDDGVWSLGKSVQGVMMF